jgi:8-oxo-dGTP pyrophosphatase MutT (NUDIX family)
MASDVPVRADSVPVSPAATVMLLRDGDDGVEVFMMQRTLNAAFARGQFVFPGGKVDDADHGEVFEPMCDGLDDAHASQLLGIDHGGLAWLVAAVREVFEEAGVLLARPSGSEDVVSLDDPAVADRYGEARHAIHEGRLTLAEFCAQEGLLLLVDRIRLVDHWVTPMGERRRFDTRFFVAAAPPAQHPLHDDKETIASLWVRPEDALAMWKAGELQMFPPTLASLRWLSGFPDVAAAIAGASEIGIPPVVLPRLVIDGTGKLTGVKRPGDDGYDDLCEPEFVVVNPR